MNLTQILRGQEAALTFTVYADGDPSDEGTPTLVLKDLEGVTIDTLAVNDNSDGTYEAIVPAKADLTLLSAILTFGASLAFDQGRIEIVGGFLYTEVSARNFDSGRLSDTMKYPDETLAAERIRAADWLEAETGLSWVPRYRRVTLRGNDKDRLSLYHIARSQGPSGGEGATSEITRILSLTINEEARDVADVELEGSALWLASGYFTWARRPNIVIEYEYGNPHISDGVDRVALLELVDRLPASRRDRAATSSTDELGTYAWDPQNNGRPSRIPEVNAWLRNHDQRAVIA